MLNISEVRTFAIDKTATSTKAVVNKKGLDITVQKMSYTIDSHNRDGYLCKNAHN